MEALRVSSEILAAARMARLWLALRGTDGVKKPA